MFFLCGYATAAEPVKIAVTPFTINAESDMTFLQNGIFDMLASRLGKEKNVNVIEKGEIEEALKGYDDFQNDEQCRNIGALVSADYILFGSLTIFGESVSIDARVFDVSGEKKALSFSKQLNNKAEVIPAVNMFAKEINMKLFDIKSLETESAEYNNYDAPNQDEKKNYSINMHPEKLLEKGFFNLSPDDSEGVFMTSDSFKKTETGKFWRSKRFNHRINGIAVGDINNDNIQETLILTDHNLLIYQIKDDRLIKIAEPVNDGFGNNISIDVADINFNGTPEIFITSLNTYKTLVNSFVLEYRDKRFVKILDDSTWFYRVGDFLGRKTLFAQKHKPGATQFVNPVYEMGWNGSSYVTGRKVISKKKANALGIAGGNLLSEDKDFMIFYNMHNKLTIADNIGNEIWKSGDEYGGNMLYSQKEATVSDRIGDPFNNTYFPIRIIIYDINNDGKEDVITAKNFQPPGVNLVRYRNYINSQIISFAWDGIGLAPMSKTRKMSGRISDFVIGDFDNDGKKELLVSMVITEGTMITDTPKSVLIAFEL